MDAAKVKRKLARKGYWNPESHDGPSRPVPMVFIYAFECQGIIKIGIAAHVARRLQQLNQACPFPVSHLFDLKVFAHAAADVEHQAHLALHPWHAHGEWFRCDHQQARAAVIIAIMNFNRQEAPEGWHVPKTGSGPLLERPMISRAKPKRMSADTRAARMEALLSKILEKKNNSVQD